MSNPSRREFLGSALMGAASLALGKSQVAFAQSNSTEKLALLGGKPVRATPFPSWPIVASNDEKAWADVLRKGAWCRLSDPQMGYVGQFEKAWAEMTGAKRCLATASGTTALITSLNALDIGPGDEVIVSALHFRCHH